MKSIFQFLMIAFFAICFTSCGGDDDEIQTSSSDKEIDVIWKSLNGSYKGVYYISNTDNVWYSETISFHPYSETKSVMSIIDGSITAYGTADIADTRFLDISGIEHYYYSIVIKYKGAEPYISFYEYNEESGYITNKEDRRNIADITPTSFRMWGYGLTEENNSHTYNKE